MTELEIKLKEIEIRIDGSLGRSVLLFFALLSLSWLPDIVNWLSPGYFLTYLSPQGIKLVDAVHLTTLFYSFLSAVWFFSQSCLLSEFLYKDSFKRATSDNEEIQGQ